MQRIGRWLFGLLSFVLTSVGGVGVLAMVDPAKFNFTHAGMIALAKVCGAAALFNLFYYLQHSPLSSVQTQIGVIQAANVNVQTSELQPVEETK
jgi:hypothetical protein